MKNEHNDVEEYLKEGEQHKSIRWHLDDFMKFVAERYGEAQLDKPIKGFMVTAVLEAEGGGITSHTRQAGESALALAMSIGGMEERLQQAFKLEFAVNMMAVDMTNEHMKG